WCASWRSGIFPAQGWPRVHQVPPAVVFLALLRTFVSPWARHSAETQNQQDEQRQIDRVRGVTQRTIDAQVAAERVDQVEAQEHGHSAGCNQQPPDSENTVLAANLGF